MLSRKMSNPKTKARWTVTTGLVPAARPLPWPRDCGLAGRVQTQVVWVAMAGLLLPRGGPGPLSFCGRTGPWLYGDSEAHTEYVQNEFFTSKVERHPFSIGSFG